MHRWTITPVFWYQYTMFDGWRQALIQRLWAFPAIPLPRNRQRKRGQRDSAMLLPWFINGVIDPSFLPFRESRGTVSAFHRGRVCGKVENVFLFIFASGYLQTIWICNKGACGRSSPEGPALCFTVERKREMKRWADILWKGEYRGQRKKKILRNDEKWEGEEEKRQRKDLKRA